MILFILLQTRLSCSHESPVKVPGRNDTPHWQNTLLFHTEYMLKIKKQRLADLTIKYRKTQNRVRRLMRRITVFKNKIKGLKQENLDLKKKIKKNSSTQRQMPLCFSGKRKNRKISPETKEEYEEKLKSFARSLNAISPDAYVFVQKVLKCGLPDPKTIAREYVTENDKEPTATSSDDPPGTECYQNDNGDCHGPFYTSEYDINNYGNTIEIGNNTNEDAESDIDTHHRSVDIACEDDGSYNNRNGNGKISHFCNYTNYSDVIVVQ